MLTLGAILLLAGLGGLIGKAVAVYNEETDPVREFSATVAKTRLDIKKPDGVEVYTYIVTFFVHELRNYLRMEVPQKIFDETIEKDSGTLICHPKRKKFIGFSVHGNCRNQSAPQ